MKVNNPMFSVLDNDTVVEHQATMRGVTVKTALLLAITFLSAIAVMAFNINSYPLLAVASVVGLVSVIIGRTNVKAAAVCGVIYSACEGLWLGSIAVILSTIEGFEGAVPIAIVATLAIFLTMLALYSTKIVKATSTLMKVMSAAGLAIFVFFIVSFILQLFGNSVILDMFYGNTILSAVLAVLFIAYGAFMLVFNFDEAKSYVDNGLDKRYEWTAALGLMVTIIYIYIQILRFVIIILGNRKN